MRIKMSEVMDVAPGVGTSVTDYDRRHLALYAALLDADAAQTCWREAAATLMHLDPSNEKAEVCWKSHLERARWIVGDGLADAVAMFGSGSASSA
ncbi:hypothetical protein WP12_04550 [Sphingomonas sp. SRS2]|jgi:hypothetical protein|nr:hypothetical protein WP12_04550 [Sphingomonas sp. SRS2]